MKKKELKGDPEKMIYTDDKSHLSTSINLVKYNEKEKVTTQFENLKELPSRIENNYTNWLHVQGLNDFSKLKEVAQYFNLHPLVLEDIVNTEERPKLEEYEDYLFIVIKSIDYKEDKYKTEHISIILGKNYVITFCDSELSIFHSLNKRISNVLDKIRKEKSDYLAYSIIDTIVDQYYTITESIGDYTENLEDDLIFKSIQKESIQEIQELKHRFIELRRIIYPSKELVTKLLRIEHPFIKAKTITYIKDLFDHILQITENIEIYREMSWNLMEIYMATVNNKMNEIMKVLTIMASIFIPLTFIAGIYGMNFVNMPELHWHFGYFYSLGLMCIIMIVMLIYFKRKKWI